MHKQQEGCIMLHSLVTAHSFMSAYAVGKRTQKRWVMGFANACTGL